MLVDVDQNSMDLIFKMAQDVVLNGRKVLDPLAYIELAALKLQIQFGDYNESNQIQDYVVNNLAQFLPIKLNLQDSKQEQQDSIFRTYQQFRGKDTKQATLDFINAVFPIETAESSGTADESDVPEHESKEDSIPEDKPQAIQNEKEPISVSLSRARSFTLSNIQDIRLENLRAIVVKAVDEVVVSLKTAKGTIEKTEKKEDIIPHVLLVRNIEAELPKEGEEEIPSGTRSRRGTFSGLGVQELKEYVKKQIDIIVSSLNKVKEEAEDATTTEELIQPAQIIKKITKIKS